MRAQAHLEQDGTCAIDNKSGDRVGVNRALGGEGLSACSGDILLESLVACAGVTLGQIANAMEADSYIMPPTKYWEIVADKLSAAGWSWTIAAPLPEMAGAGLLMPTKETANTTSSNLTSY